MCTWRGKESWVKETDQEDRDGERDGGEGGKEREKLCEESEGERPAGSRERKGLSEVEEELLWVRWVFSSRSGKF